MYAIKCSQADTYRTGKRDWKILSEGILEDQKTSIFGKYESKCELYKMTLYVEYFDMFIFCCSATRSLDCSSRD